ncbi:filament-like plant protein [Solanum dulcamara]|uniref:filament-like plant protein n=1 Tax=Solanum dulcamara TaxID=45834 RepID=UPI002484EBF2|nr:filament-like plant protein [Solanum dulcamara]XP_055830077.1 filament-like plant protein [Solanum dulcamara]XP_055830078.1 filament-like plant protein [Solanum dulcamara]
MDKRNWLWKRRSSEKSIGETESSGSLSSHSERHSDEQDQTPDNDNQLPEVTSKVATIGHEAKESPKKLIEKLSAALVNVSAKEDLVKQHAKVAEEAVAGWEKAENEVAVLKQQLEAAVQQNSTLDVRVNHLNGALKECVRQLRQARDEQDQRIQDAVVEKEKEWESVKAALENQLLELQTQAEASRTGSPVSTDPNVLVRLECLEKENTALKLDLSSHSEELQIRSIERDLSNQAAETASKQQLESIKKVTKLEAECRRLQALARKSSLLSDQRSSAVSSFSVESFANSQSSSGDRLKTVDTDSHMLRKLETSECDHSCSDSWASALITKLDQFKHDKAMPKTLAARSLEIDMMDDFLEMERFAAVSETVNKASSLTSDAVADDSSSEENPLAGECETLSQRVVGLEQKLEKIEAEKAELENALSESQDALKVSDLQLKDAQIKLEELQKELDAVNESKELLEFQLFGMEVEGRTMSANIAFLKTEVERERSLSSDKETKCQELEHELQRKSQEFELQQASSSNGELKIKQEDLAVAADKLAECQKTIASLGKQLQSLATLEDFLIDTANLPGFSGEGSVVAGASGEEWKLHVNETFSRKSNSDSPKIENSSHSMNGNEGESSSSSSSSSTSSATQVTTSKSRNGFGKLFSRSKSGIQL